jgi:hypothetical protein
MITLKWNMECIVECQIVILVSQNCEGYIKIICSLKMLDTNKSTMFSANLPGNIAALSMDAIMRMPSNRTAA